MTKEQEDSLEILKNAIADSYNRITNPLIVKALETVLSMLKEKDKQIDLMAIVIGNEPLPIEEYCIFRNFDCPVVGGNRDCKDCIKQYFENKAKELLNK